MRRIGWAVLGAAVLLLAAGAAVAQDEMGEMDDEGQAVQSGETLYQLHCAACHGAEARGDGPVAETLRKAPADLTTIGARHGGTFPEAAILRVILGTDAVVAHGTREMPVWGERFAAGQPPGMGAVSERRSKALLLIDYLKSIQRQADATAP